MLVDTGVGLVYTIPHPILKVLELSGCYMILIASSYTFGISLNDILNFVP